MTHNWGAPRSACVYCGKTGTRQIVQGGRAHKRCIPKPNGKQTCSNCQGTGVKFEVKGNPFLMSIEQIEANSVRKTCWECDGKGTR